MTRILVVIQPLFLISVFAVFLVTDNAISWTFRADFEKLENGSYAQGASGFHNCGSTTTVTSSLAHSGQKAARFKWIYPEWTYSSDTIGFDHDEYMIYDSAGGFGTAGGAKMFRVIGSSSNDGIFYGKGSPDAFHIFLHHGYNAQPVTELPGRTITIMHGNEGFTSCRGEITYPSSTVTERISEDTEVWARAYFYFQSPWSWACAPAIKVLRIVNLRHSDGSAGGLISVYSDRFGRIRLSNEPGGVAYSCSDVFDLDRWQCIEIYVKLSTEAGVIRIWKDGNLIIEDTSRLTVKEVTDYATNAWFMSWWNGGPTQQQNNYVDDVIITTDRPKNEDRYGNSFIGLKHILESPSNLKIIQSQDE